MKQLLEQVLQDTDRHAAAELRQMLQAEMAKPPEERDYDRIKALSEACCEVMGVRRSAEASAATGIRRIRAHQSEAIPEAECETYLVEEVRPQLWQPIVSAAAACLIIAFTVAGGGVLLREQSAQNVPAPQPEPSESNPQETAVTSVETVPVYVPIETAETAETAAAPVETAPPMTVVVTENAAPSAPEPAQTAPAVSPATQTTAFVQTQATETQTETVTETLPVMTETTPAETEPLPEPTLPLETAPTTRLLKLKYELGWVPEGYVLTDTAYDLQEDYEVRTLTYQSDADTIVFRQRTRNAPPLAPFETDESTGDYTVSSIRIGPYTGYLAEGDAGCTMTWDVGEYLFTLTGPDANDLKRAALMLCIVYEN